MIEIKDLTVSLGDFVLQDAIAHQLIERYESEYAAMLDGERRQLRESLIADAERAAAIGARIETGTA